MTKKTDWENFCQQRGIAEDEIKTQLFNGELSENDFCYINKNIQDNIFLNGPRYSIDYYRLFNDCPHLVERCNWNMLDGRSWIELLKKQPEFSDKCNWTKLTGSDWALIIEELPQYSDKCNWQKLNSENWSSLLSQKPQFANKCDKWDIFRQKD